MPEEQSWRCKNMSLIFACRVVAERFGPEAVDLLARHHLERVRAAFREKAAAGAPNGLEALAEQIKGISATHEHQIIRQDDRVLEFKVTRCAHAELFAAWNALDLGLKFMCSGDEAMIEGLNPRITLERPRLLMKGDECCHFIYQLDG